MITDFTRLKVLAWGQASCHGGKAQWTPYVPIEICGRIEPCFKGLHYCEGMQILDWLGEELWLFEDLAETRVRNKRGLGKFVTSKGMITERVKTWNLKTERLFVTDCVEPLCRGFPILEEALRTARAYANGQIDDMAMWEARKEILWGHWDITWPEGVADLVHLCLSKPTPTALILARSAGSYTHREWQWRLLKGYLNG